MASSIGTTRFDDLFTTVLSSSADHRQAACTAIFRKMIIEDDMEGIQAIKRHPVMHFYALQYSVETQRPGYLLELLQGAPITASDAGCLLRKALRTSCALNVRLLLQNTIVCQADFEEAAVEAVKTGSIAHIEAILTGAARDRGLRMKMIAAIDHRIEQDQIPILIPEGWLAADEAQEVLVAAASRGATGLINYLLRCFLIERDTLKRALSAAIKNQQRVPFDLHLCLDEHSPEAFVDALDHEAWEILARLIEVQPLSEEKASELAVDLCDRNAFDLVMLILDRQLVSARARAFILTRAAGSTQTALLLRLLQGPLEIDQPALGLTLIHAARQQSFEVVHQLLSRYEFANSDLITVLEPIALSGNIALTKQALAKVAAVPPDTLTALIHQAAKLQQRDITHLLLGAIKNERIIEASMEKRLIGRLMLHAATQRDSSLFCSVLSCSQSALFKEGSMRRFFYTFCHPLPVPSAICEAVALPELHHQQSLLRLFQILNTTSFHEERADTVMLCQGLRTSSVGTMISKTRLELLSESEFKAMSEEGRFKMMKQFFNHGFGDDSLPVNDYATYCRLHSLTREYHQRFFDRVIGNFETGEIDKVVEFGVPNPRSKPIAFKAFFKQIYFELTHLLEYTQRSPENGTVIAFRLLECMNDNMHQMQAGIHALFCQFIQKEIEDPLTRLFFDAVDAEIQCASQEFSEMVSVAFCDMRKIREFEELTAAYSYRMQVNLQSLGLTTLGERTGGGLYLKFYNHQRLCQRICREFSNLSSPLKADFEARWRASFPPTRMPDKFLADGMDGDLVDLNERFLRFVQGDRAALNTCEERIARAYLSSHGSSASVASETFLQFAKSHIGELSSQEGLASRRAMLERQWQQITDHLDRDGQLKFKAALRWLAHLQLITIPEVDEVLIDFLK